MKGNLPEKGQIRIIKSYFPRMDSEGRLLAGMMEGGAIGGKGAVKLAATPLGEKDGEVEEAVWGGRRQILPDRHRPQDSERYKKDIWIKPQCNNGKIFWGIY